MGDHIRIITREIMQIEDSKTSQPQQPQTVSAAQIGATVFNALVGLAILVICIALVVQTGANTHANNRVLVDSNNAPVTCAKPDNVIATGIKAFMSLTFADVANLNSIHFAVELPD